MMTLGCRQLPKLWARSGAQTRDGEGLDTNNRETWSCLYAWREESWSVDTEASKELSGDLGKLELEHS